MQKNTGLVYSTEQGRMCPDCRQPLNQCRCKKQNLPLGDGKVRIQYQTKGRKGKGVTLISGLALNQIELTELCRQLKKKCGSGGTLKQGVIEIQGEYCERLRQELETLGINAKISGGKG